MALFVTAIGILMGIFLLLIKKILNQEENQALNWQSIAQALGLNFSSSNGLPSLQGTIQGRSVVLPIYAEAPMLVENSV